MFSKALEFVKQRETGLAVAVGAAAIFLLAGLAVYSPHVDESKKDVSRTYQQMPKLAGAGVVLPIVVAAIAGLFASRLAQRQQRATSTMTKVYFVLVVVLMIGASVVASLPVWDLDQLKWALNRPILNYVYDDAPGKFFGTGGLSSKTYIDNTAGAKGYLSVLYVVQALFVAAMTVGIIWNKGPFMAKAATFAAEERIRAFKALLAQNAPGATL